MVPCIRTSSGPSCAGRGIRRSDPVPLSLGSESGERPYTPVSTCASTRRTISDAAMFAATWVPMPVTISTADSHAVPGAPRAAPRCVGARTSPAHCRLGGILISPSVSARAPRVPLPCPPGACASSRSRAFSGCSSSTGPPTMCNATTSWPGTAVIRMSFALPRSAPTRTDCLILPRVSPAGSGGGAAPRKAPARSCACGVPANTKVIDAGAAAAIDSSPVVPVPAVARGTGPLT